MTRGNRPVWNSGDVTQANQPRLRNQSRKLAAMVAMIVRANG